MCTTCGCGHGETRIDGVPADGAVKYRRADGVPHRHADGTWHVHEHGDGHAHDHVHPHGDGHAHTHAGPLGAVHAEGLSPERIVQIEEDILGANNASAAVNRRRFAERGIFALNLVSSPGSGKTTLLVETIKALAGRLPVSVIEGDQQTSLDADRIRATGAPAVQINTGKGCHLDARMVGDALDALDPLRESVVLIENVGNLVCPAAFDLGEAHKVVILSVTEGDDKPLKYPDMFHAADLMLLNKVDLLPYVAFDVERAIANARRVRPDLRVMCVSATKHDGFAEWLGWIEGGARECASALALSPALSRSREREGDGDASPALSGSREHDHSLSPPAGRGPG